MEKLSAFDSNSFGAEFPNLWNVPIRHVPYFTGQQDVLQEMQSLLTSTYQPVALTAASGLGKTRVAAEYAYMQRGQYMEDGILWLNALSKETLLEDFQKATIINAHHTDTVKEWLDIHKNALVILDHIDDEELAKEFTSCKNHLLITSSNEIAGMKNIPVGAVSEEEGALILLKRSQSILSTQTFEHATQTQQQDALRFSQLLGNMPAKLEAIGEIIEDCGSSIGRYLQFAQSGTININEIKERRAENPL